MRNVLPIVSIIFMLGLLMSILFKEDDTVEFTVDGTWSAPTENTNIRFVPDHLLHIGDIVAKQGISYIGYLDQRQGIDASLTITCNNGVPHHECVGSDCAEVFDHLLSEPGVHFSCR